MAAAPGVQSERRGHYLSHDKSFLYGDLPHRGRGATTPQEPQAHKLSSTRRNPAPGNTTSILYKLSLFTYHAYNWTGKGSLYTDSNLLDYESDLGTPTAGRLSCYGQSAR